MVNTSNQITLAAGRITCKRCQALSKRTKQQCGRPAMKGKRVCNFHGGKSTGPKTAEGRSRISTIRTIFGTETVQRRNERSRVLAELALIDNYINHLSSGKQKITPGRKPKGYKSLTCEETINWLRKTFL